MQTKTGAFLSTGRIPQYIGQAALAASVFAGGASLLNAGGAMAVPCPIAGTFDSPNAGDFKSSCPLLPGGDITTLAVDYDPAALITGIGSYNYSVATISPPNPGPFFREIGLGVDVNGIGTYSVTVTKEVFTSAGGTSLGTLVFNQTNSGSSYTGDLLVNPIYESLYIVDSYAVTGGTVGIDKITNTFESVPGPLPILGAGAAFGFSRKLRGRIKAARLS